MVVDGRIELVHAESDDLSEIASSDFAERVIDADRKYLTTIAKLLAILIVAAALFTLVVLSSDPFDSWPNYSPDVRLSSSDVDAFLSLLAAVIIALQVAVRSGSDAEELTAADRLARQLVMEKLAALTGFIAMTIGMQSLVHLVAGWHTAENPGEVFRIIMQAAAGALLAVLAIDAYLASQKRLGPTLHRVKEQRLLDSLRVFRATYEPHEAWKSTHTIQIISALVVPLAIAAALSFPTLDVAGATTIFLLMLGSFIWCAVWTAIAYYHVLIRDLLTVISAVGTGCIPLALLGFAIWNSELTSLPADDLWFQVGFQVILTALAIGIPVTMSTLLFSTSHRSHQPAAGMVFLLNLVDRKISKLTAEETPVRTFSYRVFGAVALALLIPPAGWIACSQLKDNRINDPAIAAHAKAIDTGLWISRILVAVGILAVIVALVALSVS